MKKIIPAMSVKTEILGIVFFSILFITASLGYLTFTFSRNRLIFMLGESSKQIASTAATLLNAADLVLIRDNIDRIEEERQKAIMPALPSPYQKMIKELKPRELPDRTGPLAEAGPSLDPLLSTYIKYRKLLEQVKSANNIEGPINIYAKVANRFTIMLSSEKKMVLVGVPYKLRLEANRAMADNRAETTGIYQDKDGIWISAYAPITAVSGFPMAVIEINHRIDSYIRKLQREIGMILLICLVGFLVTGSLSYQLVDRLVSSIKKLDEVAANLEKENYNIRITVKSENEIGHLARTFEKLRVSIKNKIEDLRLLLIKEEKAHLESVIALTNAIGLRDPYTRQHLYRVDKYALLISRAMRLPKQEVKKLRYGCYLHDIGKIFIDDALFQKSSLTKAELEDIREHAQKGTEVIKGIPFLQKFKDMILYHQERYDGKGYPSGLKGNDIPLLARIVAVADAFDAMTSDRPYKPKMRFSEAIDNLEKFSGTQFDPEVAKALLKYRGTIEKIAAKHFHGI